MQVSLGTTGVADVQVITSAALTTASLTAAFKANPGDSCDTANGRYGIVMNDDFKLCPLCPAGTYSDEGNGCTSCEGGKRSGVGATSCATCSKGTYAEGGEQRCW